MYRLSFQTLRALHRELSGLLEQDPKGIISGDNLNLIFESEEKLMANTISRTIVTTTIKVTMTGLVEDKQVKETFTFTEPGEIGALAGKKLAKKTYDFNQFAQGKSKVDLEVKTETHENKYEIPVDLFVKVATQYAAENASVEG